MPPEVTVEAPTTRLTASQVRNLLADVERKEQAAKPFTVKDVKPGQYFKFLRGTDGLQGECRFRIQCRDYLYVKPNGILDNSTNLLDAPVVLVRNFDGEAL